MTESDFGQSSLDYMCPVPHDLVELEHIVPLLEKLPEFRRKLSELRREVGDISRVASEQSKMSNFWEIERLIFRSFFIDMENRAFQSPTEAQLTSLRANIVHDGIISNRNIPCEICGENRVTDKCHIIPRKLGGPDKPDNLLCLCPTHHRLFDRFMLSRAEFAAIDWERKAVAASQYAHEVILVSHLGFWKKIDKGEFERLELYKSEDTKPFIRYAVIQILSIFSDDRVIEKSRVYDVVDPMLREMSKRIIPELVKLGHISQTKVGKKSVLRREIDTAAIDKQLIDNIWRKVN